VEYDLKMEKNNIDKIITNFLKKRHLKYIISQDISNFKIEETKLQLNQYFICSL